MGGTIHLSTEDNVALTIALQLEAAGYATAARWLRDRIPGLRPVWRAQDAEDAAARPHVPAADLFSAHRGSVPPHRPAPPSTPTS